MSDPGGPAPARGISVGMGISFPAGWMRAAGVATRAIEREVLGFALPPPADERTATGWTPDRPGAWCLRCGSGRPVESRSSRGCPDCRGRRLPYEAIVRLGAYREPLDGWLLRIKRRRWHAMGEMLGDELAGQCREVWGPAPFEAVVPIPMPWLRRIWRGIDHSALLASRVARAFRVPVVRALVHQGGRTQVGRSRTERLRRRSPFRIDERLVPECERFGRLVLVDDVRSTGSTVRQAAGLLQTRFPGTEIKVAVAAIAELDVRDRPLAPAKPLDFRPKTE